MTFTNFSELALRKSPARWRNMLFLAGGVAMLLVCAPTQLLARSLTANNNNIEVTPGEDLMREHGVLRRTLMVYEAALSQLPYQESKAKSTTNKAALLIKRFIENYHEKIEEDYIFPRFEQVGKLTALVRTLKNQHDLGRELTNQILLLTKQETLSPKDRQQLVGTVKAFIKMYRAHAAREDTILFPEFHTLVGQNEYERLGEQFEQIEHQILGEGGFESAVLEVATLEQEVGISDLNQFTKGAIPQTAKSLQYQQR